MDDRPKGLVLATSVLVSRLLSLWVRGESSRSSLSGELAAARTSDEPFLEVAVAAVVVLVTGNLRHFPARLRSGVLVVSPRGFLELLR